MDWKPHVKRKPSMCTAQLAGKLVILVPFAASALSLASLESVAAQGRDWATGVTTAVG